MSMELDVPNLKFVFQSCSLANKTQSEDGPYLNCK